MTRANALLEEHLYLSPHFDDAILSCGGLIYAQRQAGKRVRVLTLCARSPGAETKSALALEYESAWEKSGGGSAQRCAENKAVLSAWGVESWECNTLDAIYRAAGQAPYYETRAALFLEPNPRDAAFMLPIWRAQVEQLAAVHGTILYAPLGVGRHLDHELARRLGQRMHEAGWQVWFYEDYPYVEIEPDGVAAARARFGYCEWTSQVVPINVQAKIEAVRGYRTQLERVFGSDKDLWTRVKSFTAETACTLSLRERLRRILAPSGMRLRIWRRVIGYHAHAERIWRPS